MEDTTPIFPRELLEVLGKEGPTKPMVVMMMIIITIGSVGWNKAPTTFKIIPWSKSQNSFKIIF